MTDLHCHLLPGVDDGAKDVDMSLELLTQERNQGVTNIIFTSHFRPDREDLHAFLKKRNKAFGTLMDA
ncbi:MAG: capsular biosynthesis protein, partial [Clostridia bacterium]|nr:capsular biosynthesis protein [Clostridia bacterium]